MDYYARDVPGTVEAKTFLRRRVWDDLARHGAVMVTYSVISGVFMYLYQLSMSILLKPQDYGVLFSLTSLFSIVMISSQTLSTTVSRFVSKARVSGGLARVSALRWFFYKWGIFTGAGIFIISALLSPAISRFLNSTNTFYIIILFSATLTAFPFVTNQGTLNGLQRFTQLGVSLVFENFLILIIGVLLVYLGWGIYGALVAHPVSYAVVLITSSFFLRNLPKHNNNVTVETVGRYAWYAFVSILAFTAVTNIDAVLAKHYFDAFTAGNYATIAVMGRIILYAPLGIATAMFPKTAYLYETKGDCQGTFNKAILITSLTSFSIVLIYVLFPRLIVSLLFADKYPLLSDYLGRYGLAMFFFGFSYVAMRYMLSINEVRVAYSLVGIVILQITLMGFSHSSISHMVNNMLISSIASVVSISFFLLKVRKNPRYRGK